MDSSDDMAPLVAFLQQYAKDCESGAVRDLVTYLTMFPGDQNTIAQFFLRFEGDLDRGSPHLDVSAAPASVLRATADPYFFVARSVETPHSQRREERSDRVNALANLRARLNDLVRPAIKLTATERIDPVRDLLESRFGGSPYAEAGDRWPVCHDCGRPLDFVCQFDLRGCGHAVPPGIDLFTFYYCWETGPWGLDGLKDVGWEVRTYVRPAPDRAVILERPRAPSPETYATKDCAVTMEATSSVPDYNDIERWFPEIDALARVLNPTLPFLPYRNLFESTMCLDSPFQSRIGGWPTWVHGSPLPAGKERGPMRLLAQIDSEYAANLMWGDSGCVYLLVDPANPTDIRMSLECG
jgi:uncharacterized protein YwqG